jgi:hypothetical protein
VTGAAPIGRASRIRSSLIVRLLVGAIGTSFVLIENLEAFRFEPLPAMFTTALVLGPLVFYVATYRTLLMSVIVGVPLLGLLLGLVFYLQRNEHSTDVLIIYPYFLIVGGVCALGLIADLSIRKRTSL